LYNRYIDTLGRQDQYSKEEIFRRAEEIFERDIRPNLVGKNDQWFVAIDIETGDYEVDPDLLAASDRLKARKPDAYLWLRRVGSPCAFRMVGLKVEGYFPPLK
jgi:hypothetical protein